jgi:hypothetical protein
MTPHPTESSYDALTGAIRGFGGFRKRWAVLEGLAWFVIAGPGSFLAWLLLDWVFRLPAWLLLPSFVAVVGASAYSAVFRLGRALARSVDTAREAIIVESLHGGLDNQLIGSLQLGREVADHRASGRPLGYSAALVGSLVDRTAGAFAGLDARGLVDRGRARRLLRGAGAISLVAVLFLALARGTVADRFSRLGDAYAALLDAIFPVEMRVFPGDIAVLRGRPVTIGVEVTGARRREVRLVRKDLGPGEELADVLSLENEKASLKIPEAQESFAYAFEYGGRKTPEHRVLVGERPKISAINYEIAYPAYTGQPPRTIVGRVPRLHGLAGTSVLVSFAATTELHPERCYVEWRDGSRQPLPVTGRFGDFSFTVDRSDRASIYLTGIYGPGFEMERPLSFDIDVQRDQPPSVTVLLRRKKLTMLAEEAVAFGLRWLAEDDFGIAEASMRYRIEGVDEFLRRPVREGTVPRRFTPPRDRVRGAFLEVFKDVRPPLEPGDKITITISARDNNTESGPGLGKSRPVEIVIVRRDLKGFVEKQFGFGSRALLAGLHRIKRATDLLVEPQKSVRSEKVLDIGKKQLKARVSQETWPGGAEDAVGDYFMLLSGAE